jgi:CubicO group peptidase (beta-lactamase class C family)
MMCHRTGLPRHDFSWYLFNTDSRDSLLLRLKYQEPTAGVRQRWQYNNFMFMVQGMIVEKISGVSWEQNIKDRTFSTAEHDTIRRIDRRIGRKVPMRPSVTK